METSLQRVVTLKRIFILNGHPAKASLSKTLADQYGETAAARGHEVRLSNIQEMDFDSDFGFGGYVQIKSLEPALEQFLADLRWADHIVLVTPMWWGGLPAKLKGLVDRSFLPGKAFDTRTKTLIGFPSPMFEGKTARVIVTSDSPNWLMAICYGNALFRQIRHQVLGFVGIKPTRFTHLNMATHPKPGQVQSWLQSIEKLAAQGA